MSDNKGMVYVFEGDGKGKTSAALGVAVRMLLVGQRVEWIAWYKQRSWKTAEMGLPKVFGRNLRMHWTGEGFFGGPKDRATFEGHKKAAEKALLLAKRILKDGNKRVGLLVLDEVLRAVNDGLLSINEVIKMIDLRRDTHLLLTGDKCPSRILKKTDLVTRMKKIKHPFDKGMLAVSGPNFEEI